MINVTAKNEYFFREPRLNRVIVLDSLNYLWEREDLKKLKRMRAKGLAVKEMVYEFEDRDPDETLIALIHLATNEEEKYRKHEIVVCENLDFLWDWRDLRELIQIWELELSVRYASEYFGREKGDILLAVMHLARINKIKRRRGGLF